MTKSPSGMGELGGGYFEQHLAELVTLLQLWDVGMNKKKCGFLWR